METTKKSQESFQQLIDKELGRGSFLELIGLGIVSAGIATIPAEIIEAAEKISVQRKFRYGMVIDLGRCVNCKACTIACKLENKTPPGVEYNPVIEEEVGEYPYVKRNWFPKPCFHCEHPPCTNVCPVSATYKRPEDGIVIVDYKKLKASIFLSFIRTWLFVSRGS